MHRDCQQFDRLWALGPCDLIDLSRTTHTHTLPPPRAPLHSARSTATGLGIVDAHHSNPQRSSHWSANKAPSSLPITITVDTSALSATSNVYFIPGQLSWLAILVDFSGQLGCFAN